MDLPIPSITPRPQSAQIRARAQALGYTPLQATVLAGRLRDAHAPDLERTVRPRGADLDAPQLLPDIEVAAERLCRAIVDQEPILIASDHDCDGVTGHAILRAALLDIFGHPGDRLHSFISHRLREGYGISDGVVDRIAGAGHDRGVLVSVDQGSSDEPRIARLAGLGIDTVVTDHHGVEGKGPASAVACVNPAREDSRYPDPTIAGCYTAWLTLCAVRRELIERRYLPEETPELHSLLDFAALGVVADCVDLGASRNNRLVVQRGLLAMNRAPRPCWQAARAVLRHDGPFTAQDLAFSIGPMINARGRLDEAMAGVRFLRAQTFAQAMKLASALQACNEERKLTEKAMKLLATKEALRQLEAGHEGLAIWLEEGHSGVHGIVASRLTSDFGRPTVCLSPKVGYPDLVTGSARTIPGFHVRQALAAIAAEAPDLFVAFGGHAGAGGLTLRRCDIARFQALWDAAVRAATLSTGPVVLTDGTLPVAPALPVLAELAALAPYGRAFDVPVFQARAQLLAAREIGAGGGHMRLQLRVGETACEAVWFNVPKERIAECCQLGERTVAFELDQNTFRGETKLQLLVRAVA